MTADAAVEERLSTANPATVLTKAKDHVSCIGVMLVSTGCHEPGPDELWTVGRVRHLTRPWPGISFARRDTDRRDISRPRRLPGWRAANQFRSALLTWALVAGRRDHDDGTHYSITPPLGRNRAAELGPRGLLPNWELISAWPLAGRDAPGRQGAAP